VHTASLPAGLTLAASRAQHLNRTRTYPELAPEALEPCDMCGRTGPHSFHDWAVESARWIGQCIREAAAFAGENGLQTTWCGDHDLADAA